MGQKVAPKEPHVPDGPHVPCGGALYSAVPATVRVLWRFLSSLHRKDDKELYEMLGFQAGLSVNDKPVFQTFKIDDALGEH